MTETAEHIEQIRAGLRALVAEPLGALGDAELLSRAAQLERIGRLADAARVALGGEVAFRCRAELGDESLSRSENFATPVKLLAALTGVSSREARARMALGRQLRGVERWDGLPDRRQFPAVSDALALGEVGVESATAIVRECGALAERGVAPDSVAEAEALLVGAARQPAIGADDVARLGVRVREHLDPDGAEPRENCQHELRGLTLARSADGMFRGRIALTPEQGALWVGATEALLSPRIAPRFTTAEQFVEQQATADTRTGPQRLVDAATELIARAAAADEMPHSAGATTTLNVHVSLADLEAGHGPGWVDGITDPIPSSAMDQLRCHAPVAVTVFGDRGEILHHGKARRLFSPAQNRALAARDGGCVWPGCDRPPSWCESHHVDQWRRPEHAQGRTDVDNGVLLCHFHHSHLHRSSWVLRMQHGVPQLIPPRWIDADQIPISVTRRRTLLGPASVFAANVVAAARSWLAVRSNAPPRATAA
jgi:hypothetical protein